VRHTAFGACTTTGQLPTRFTLELGRILPNWVRQTKRFEMSNG